VKRTITRKPDEKITKSGQVLIMREPVQQKQFSSIKLSMGKSKQTLQISKTLNKVKSKPTLALVGAGTSPAYSITGQSKTTIQKPSLVSITNTGQKQRKLTGKPK